jgi:hypothetical protein
MLLVSESDASVVKGGDSSTSEEDDDEDDDDEESSDEVVDAIKTPAKKPMKKAVVKKPSPKALKKPVVKKVKEVLKKVRGKAKKELPKITQGVKGSKVNPLEIIDAQESYAKISLDRGKLWKAGKILYLDPDSLDHAALDVNQREFSENYAHELEGKFMKEGYYDVNRFHCTIYLEDIFVTDETSEGAVLASVKRLCVAGNHSFKAAQYCKARMLGLGAKNTFLTIPVQILNGCTKHETLMFSIRHNDKGALFKPQSMMDRAKFFRMAWKNPEKFNSTADSWKDGAVDTVYQDKTKTTYVSSPLYYIICALRVVSILYFLFLYSILNSENELKVQVNHILIIYLHLPSSGTPRAPP